MPVPDNITTLSFRVNAVEQDVGELRKQLDHYVPIRENDLRLQRIADDVGEVRKQLIALDTKLTAAEEARNKLLIKVLWGAVSLIITILAALLINYITHLF